MGAAICVWQSVTPWTRAACVAEVCTLPRASHFLLSLGRQQTKSPNLKWKIKNKQTNFICIHIYRNTIKRPQTEIFAHLPCFGASLCFNLGYPYKTWWKEMNCQRHSRLLCICWWCPPALSLSSCKIKKHYHVRTLRQTHQQAFTLCKCSCQWNVPQNERVLQRKKQKQIILLRWMRVFTITFPNQFPKRCWDGFFEESWTWLKGDPKQRRLWDWGQKMCSKYLHPQDSHDCSINIYTTNALFAGIRAPQVQPHLFAYQ